MNKALLMAAAVLALAGCKKKADDAVVPTPVASVTPAALDTPAPTASAKTMAMSDYVGTWNDTYPDGTKGTTVIHSDGSYSATDGKGVKSMGKFAAKDGKACFTPAAAGKPAMCWTVGAAGADGMMPATADDGSKMMVKKA